MMMPHAMTCTTTQWARVLPQQKSNPTTSTPKEEEKEPESFLYCCGKYN